MRIETTETMVVTRNNGQRFIFIDPPQVIKAFYEMIKEHRKQNSIEGFSNERECTIGKVSYVSMLRVLSNGYYEEGFGLKEAVAFVEDAMRG